MQHTQQNYKLRRLALYLAAAWLWAVPAQAGTIAHASAPDPILSGSAPGPCDPQSQGADYVAGTDINGNPVAPADIGGKAPLPKEMLVPLGHHRGQIVLTQAELAALLNKPACRKH